VATDLDLAGAGLNHAPGVNPVHGLAVQFTGPAGGAKEGL
jgi:hypothetical protein